MPEPKVVVIPQVPYASRQREIKDATYISYCSHLRKARFQFEQTQHPYWRDQVEKWEQKILRSGRELPIDTQAEAVVFENAAQEAASAETDAAVTGVLAAMVRDEMPEVDVTDAAAVAAAAKELLRRKKVERGEITPPTPSHTGS